MVCTKTIIHLSVGESGVYLPPLRGVIVNYDADLQIDEAAMVQSLDPCLPDI